MVPYVILVDQLEMGIFKKINAKTSEILQAHRLNLEDVCLIFSSPTIRSSKSFFQTIYLT